jgi:hypothetical protein
MTNIEAKEKAVEIVANYYAIISGVGEKLHKKNLYENFGFLKKDSHVKTAIQCAILQVKAIIKESETFCVSYYIGNWQQILSELEKM